MEIIGWITIILLCALALTFIVIELGPTIHSEVSMWKFRKQKSLEAKEDKAKFKREMKALKYKAKKLAYAKKKGLQYDDNIDMPNVESNVIISSEELLDQIAEASFSSEEVGLEPLEAQNEKNIMEIDMKQENQETVSADKDILENNSIEKSSKKAKSKRTKK